MQFGDTTVTMSQKEFYHTMEEVFPTDVDDLEFRNFQIAFGLTAFDSNPDPIEDPSYGRIFAVQNQWGHEGQNRTTELQIHYCSDEELGLSGDKEKSLFYPIFENNYAHVNFYKRKMYCID